MNETYTFQQPINAPAAEIYRAFTNATMLRAWLCDVATVRPSPGGRIYLAWSQGFYVAGHYTALEPNHTAAFTWFGKDEPAPTLVTVTIGADSLLTLKHSGFGSDETWAHMRKETEESWPRSLENLASVLENGADQRIVLRPMMGITFGDSSAQTQGLVVGGVVSGLGAEQAGLQAGDILLEMGGQPLVDFSSPGAILQSRRAGEQVEVVYLREGERRSMPLTLSRRPIPELPKSMSELAGVVRSRQQESDRRLDEFLQGVSEEEASFRPGEGEWSIKDVLAHILLGERYSLFYLADLANDFEPTADDWAGNYHPQTQAIVEAYGSLAELVAELKRSESATAALLSAMPGDFAERKAPFWRMAFQLSSPDYHLDEHLGQMQAALSAARANN